jgi:hypothetical protein
MKGMKALYPVKPIFVLSLLFAINCGIKAQTDTVRNQEQFLFPEFNVGIARMLNGEKVILNLNYNIVTQKMVFIQNNQIFDIVNQTLIDTVFLEGRRFIPYNKVFYEIAVNGNASFFIQHKGALKRPPRPAAYGGTSQVSSSTYINNMRLGNDRFRMQQNTEIIIEQGPLFWIRKGNEMYLVNRKKSLLKIFGDKKSEVKEFMGRQKFDPENPDHIYNLINYYNGLL